jgi:hypothetical protein
LVDKQRRKLLGLTGTALATGLAGCGGNSDGSVESGNSGTEDGNEDTGGESSQDQDAVIEFLDREGIQTVPIVTEETSQNTASIEVEVEDADGLENVLLQYNDSHRDQPLTLYNRSRDEFEQGVNGEMIPISKEFPQTVIAPNTGEFYIEVTDVNGNTTTRTEPIEGLENSFRADRKRKQEGNIGNYSTDRNWDNINTDTEQVQEKHQNWLDQNAYTPLVNQILDGEDVDTTGNVYPNWEGEDRGFFDQDEVKNEDDFETLVRWYLPAIYDHDDDNYGTAPSSRFHRFAATMETLINEHHPEAEADATGVNSIPAHGIFGVQDTNNEEFYLVDTTASSPQFDPAIGKIGEFITSEGYSRDDLWDPFHNFSPGKPSFGTYEGQSEIGMGGLMLFSATQDLEGEYGNMFITDEWMNDAYQVLRNGGSIQPITEPIEELFYNHQTNGRDDDIGIYGTLDDTRIAVTDNQELYKTVMYNPNQSPGINEIENMLGAS